MTKPSFPTPGGGGIGGNRPQTKPFPAPGDGGAAGGNRPGSGGNRPGGATTLPVRSVVIGHRPSRFPRLMAATARARGAVGTGPMAV
ncbi:MAG: hypothetical protein ACOYK7_07965 [Pirellulales bacterium]